MIACAGCTIWSPISIAAAGLLGGGTAALLLFEPFQIRHRVSTLWGFPKIRPADGVSLAIAMIGPILIALHGRDDHSLRRIAVVLLALLICFGFLWIRGLWILQEFSVTSSIKRFVFAGLVIPGTILFAIIIGHWMFTVFVVTVMGGASSIAELTFLYVIIGGVTFVAIRAGLVFAIALPPNDSDTEEANVD